MTHDLQHSVFSQCRFGNYSCASQATESELAACKENEDTEGGVNADVVKERKTR